ncbi:MULTISPECIES: helix-turn-helix domain-containing protein [unclassified Nocardioides]|uniref:helix-turn-helix domain-containing protein n=1 Tax=unclassified Nocardioides TaxID=2615069 RepID=UPI000056F319|nr:MULTISPECIES: helix-turn-helix domain-containing protein [unclassified Nocardioides]ABL80090.1 hypothetical protein Noca_0548 [Nocardioides sp. JS614]
MTTTPKKQLTPFISVQGAPIRLFLTRQQAAVACGVSPATISRVKNTGALKAKKTAPRGGRELYRIEDLQAWFDGLDDA